MVDTICLHYPVKYDQICSLSFLCGNELVCGLLNPYCLATLAAMCMMVQYPSAPEVRRHKSEPLTNVTNKILLYYYGVGDSF